MMTLRLEKTTTRLRKPCSLLHLRGFGYKEILLLYSKTAQHTANFLTSAVRVLGVTLLIIRLSLIVRVNVVLNRTVVVDSDKLNLLK